MSKNSSRLKYIDGIKGLCLLSVCFCHFLLQFFPLGYIGWNCPNEGALDPFSFYFKYFPYSILTNNSFPLYIFIGLSAFVLAYKFFQDGKTINLQKQAITRYFRLMPMTLTACLMSTFLFRTNLMPFNDFFEVSKNNWIKGHMDACDFRLLSALKDGLLGAYIHGTELVSSLWCLQYFFLGTLLTCAILLLFGNMKNRTILYAALVAVLWSWPTYLSLLACIVSADIVCHRCEDGKRAPYAFMIAFGVIVGLFPPVLLPKAIDISVLYAIGCFCVVTGSAVLFKNNRILCSDWLCMIGQKSFSGIIAHTLVLLSVNQHLYLLLNYKGVSVALNVAINFIIFAIFSFVLTQLYDFLLTPITNRLCQKANHFFVTNSGFSEQHD